MRSVAKHEAVQAGGGTRVFRGVVALVGSLALALSLSPAPALAASLSAPFTFDGTAPEMPDLEGPSDPADPGSDDASEESDPPEQPEIPDQPGNPDQPDTPGQPDDPDQPGNPDQPEQEQPTPPLSERRAITNVHTDAVSAYFDEGQLVLASKADVDGELGKRFEADGVFFHLNDVGKRNVPQNPAFAFLGDPGDEIWIAPQTQNQAMIWPGFSTEDPALRAAAEGSQLGVRLLRAQGPGKVELYLIGDDGPERTFSSTHPLPDWSIAVPQHTHMNWAFTAPGIYLLDFQMSLELSGTVHSAEARYVFVVGELGEGIGAPPFDDPPGADGQNPNGSGNNPGVPEPGAPAAETPPCQPPVTLSAGHLDAFTVSAGGGRAVLQIKEDVTGHQVLREAETVLLQVKESAYVSNIASGVPGAPSGYLLPLSQHPSLIWPGWDTNRTSASGYTDVSINITSVRGPGRVLLYTSQGAFGGWRPILTHGGYSLPGTIHEPSPAHTHAQWVFSERGIYTLEVHAVANNPATGQRLTTASHSYVFQVGDAALGDVFCGLSPHAAGDAELVNAAVDQAAKQAVEVTAAADELTGGIAGRGGAHNAARQGATLSDAVAERTGLPAAAVASVVGGGGLALAGLVYGTVWLLRRLRASG